MSRLMKGQNTMRTIPVAFGHNGSSFGGVTCGISASSALVSACSSHISGGCIISGASSDCWCGSGSFKNRIFGHI